MASSPIPNVDRARRIYVGTETVRGTAVAPTYRWGGQLRIDRRTPILDRTEDTGGYDADTGTPVYGPAEIDGTYAVPLTFQRLATLPRYAMAPEPTPTGDGNTVEGFTYVYTPGDAFPDTATVLHGWDGMQWRSTMLLFNEFTIRADVDDANADWQWSSRVFARSKALQVQIDEVALSAVSIAGGVHVLTPTGGGLTADALVGQYVQLMDGPGAPQVGLITANTTTTITVDRTFSPAPTTSTTIEVSADWPTGIAEEDGDEINAKGTKLYIAEEGGTPTDHLQVGFKAFSVTQTANIAGKRFMEEETADYSDKIDRGMRRVTAQLTFEFDTWREYARWEEQVKRVVHISKTNGPVIDSGAGTRHTALIALPAMYYETVAEEVRGNNIIATFGGRAFVDATEGHALELTVKTDLETLP